MDQITIGHVGYSPDFQATPPASRIILRDLRDYLAKHHCEIVVSNELLELLAKWQDCADAQAELAQLETDTQRRRNHLTLASAYRGCINDLKELLK